MPKRRRRSFTPQFKAQVVLEVLAGLKSPSEIARQHKLNNNCVTNYPRCAFEPTSARRRSSNRKRLQPDDGFHAGYRLRPPASGGRGTRRPTTIDPGVRRA
jgi:hypothetical protein